jgi:hypothetical protein
VSPEQVVIIVDGGILSAILHAFIRYSANDPQFPVNDRCSANRICFRGRCDDAVSRRRTPKRRPEQERRVEVGAVWAFLPYVQH